MWEHPFHQAAYPQSAFLEIRPILVRMFRSKKKATVLAIQVTSATQKAVAQL